MKKLIYFFLLCPALLFAQATGEDLIFEIATFRVDPEHASQVDHAIAAHNNKFHASGQHGARVYNVVTGVNSGEYKWVMGPAPWSALDTRPADEAHNLDWSANVTRYLEEGGNAEYIRLDPRYSRFTKDFTINKLFVRYVDVVRGKYDQAKAILEKVHKVYSEKIPNEIYGVYFNQLPSSSSGRDLIIVSFFDKYAWMGTDDGFVAKYDEVHGKGSAEAMFAEWREVTAGQETEIWEYRSDLGGLPPLIKAAERQ